MTLFISMAALLVLLTLLLLARPLWSTRRQEGNGAEPAEIAAIRRQLAELAGLHKEGVLGEAQYDEARASLERRLVDAVLGGPAPAPTTSAKPASMRLAIALSVFVVGLAGAGYYVLGTPRALSPAATEAASTSPGADGHSVGSEQIEKMVANLASRLKTTPGDADGWAMLGRSYAALGRHDQAAQSLKQAMALRPGDAVVIADYADALAASSDRNLEGEPAQLVAKALAIDPDNVKALSLAGTVAFNRKDYAGALRHWEKMLKIAPDSEFSRQIQGGIDEARGLMSGQRPAPTRAAAASATGAAFATASTASVASPASVSGVVSLAATLAGKTSPDDTLFVFARAAEGSRMPLAIIRKKVKDLPLSFALDDSMAMSDAARLSSAKQLVIGARVSKQGDATPQAGDLQGQVGPVSIGASGIRIEINEVVSR